MNQYTCATCDATGESHGIRPAGWGMETTEHAPSTWRRWCPPCWSKRTGLDIPKPNPSLFIRSNEKGTTNA
jgi:hypothetical protein